MPKRGRPTRHEALAKQQSQALDRLVGRPLAGEPNVPETPAVKIHALIERIKACHAAENNPYQRDFSLFCRDLVFTKDEAGGGKVETMPDWPYLREVDEALVRYSPLLIEKSRRTLITWRVCAFGLWIVAGGQDPRWKAKRTVVGEDGVRRSEEFSPLMVSRENRKVVLASKKLKDEGGSATCLNERVKFMIEQFERRGCREKWPEFPTFSFTYSRLVASNGGIYSAVPQGEDQLRGAGITLVIADELGVWTEAQRSISSAQYTLQGGGHLVGIATANAGSFAHDIVRGVVKKRG